jgi:flagellar motor switch/type III secretory pathway protein FliN
MRAAVDRPPRLARVRRAATATAAREFPWAGLEPVSRGDANLLRALRRWASGALEVEAIASAASDVVGARVQVLVRRVEPEPSGSHLDGAIGITLASLDSTGARRPFRVEAERALAAACVARVLRRPPPTIADASGSTPWMAGAFGAVVLATLRRAHGGCGFAVTKADAMPSPEPEGARDDAWWADEGAVGVLCTVLVGDDAYLARVGVPRRSAALAPGPLWGVVGLRRLGATPLTLPLVASAWTSTAAEIVGLRAGDVILPAAWAISRGADGRLAGTLRLSSPAAVDGIAVELGADGVLVLRGEAEALWSALGTDSGVKGREGGAGMADSDDTAALVNALGDVPVVVRVELGEATLPAREWASLHRGDVITLGSRIGERVLLRVGGVAVARGDLVDVEGELGVRIAERIGDDRGSATE